MFLSSVTEFAALICYWEIMDKYIFQNANIYLIEFYLFYVMVH